MDIIKNISIIFISIFFESIPFLILGGLISATIEANVSDDTLAKLIPKNKVLGSIVGIILGFFLPACDCAVIPVTKRLLKKKVPINVAVSFMLASPIVNPVVLLSTYTAFYRTNPDIFWYRIIFGIVIALIIGVIIGIIFRKKEVIINKIEEYECEDIDPDFLELVEEFDNDKVKCYCKDENVNNKFISIINDAVKDIFEVVKYLIFGALLASIIQVLLPRSVLDIFKNSNILSIIALMLFAYLISLCSTSDSFVGKSLLTTFSKESIIAYLLLGPMIDIKNTIVLFGNYKKNFVLTLITLIFIIVFIFSYLVVIFL